jgi:glycosyltransferase involved in cell wall biosynthesis
VGKPASVDIYLNDAIERAIARELPIRWTQGATDEQVIQIIQESDVFLSYGTEGYGIPVLESIRMGTPVVFDGIQPAAEMVESCGAYRTKLEEVFWVTPNRGVTHEQQLSLQTWAHFVRETTHLLTGNEKRRFHEPQ